MNKLVALTKRNMKEIVRDKLSLIFCLLFPIVMLVLLESILGSLEYVPENFRIENYSVGICVFGFSFDMLFASMIVSSDKNTEFINRIKMSPVKTETYLFSFLLAILPIAMVQAVLFFAISFIFKLKISFSILLSILALIPPAIMYISFGLVIGLLVKTERQSGPVSSIIISLSGMFGGIFMPIDSLGNFGKVINFLPFSHAVKISSCFISNDIKAFTVNFLFVLAYVLLTWGIILIINARKK